MPSPAKQHTTAIAKKTVLLIRGSRPKQRRAFALGAFGGFHVMIAQRGKPNSAMSELTKLELPKEAPAGNQGAKFRQISSGLLYRDGEFLVIQSKKKITKDHLQRAREYFKRLKAGRPWNKLRITRLAEGDEGDPEELDLHDGLDGGPAGRNQDAEDDRGDVDGLTDDGRDDEVVDEWGEEDEAPAVAQAAASAPPAPEPTDRADAPQEANDEPDSGPARQSEPPREMTEAGRIADDLLKIAPLLKLSRAFDDQRKSDPGESPDANGAFDEDGPNATKESFVKSIADLLEVMSPERLRLALCYSANIDSLSSSRDSFSKSDDTNDRGKPRAGKDPIKNDDEGHAEISDALAAYGQRIAQERGILAAGETVKADARIDAMVAQAWQRSPDASSEKILMDLLNLLSVIFEKRDSKFVRSVLGVPAEKPAATNWADFEKAGNGWKNAEKNARDGIQRLANVILDEYKDQPDAEAQVNSAISMLVAFSERLEGEFKATLDHLLVEQDANAREGMRDEAVSVMNKMQSFLVSDEIASTIDGNEFVPNLAIIAPLLEHLSTMQAALARAA